MNPRQQYESKLRGLTKLLRNYLKEDGGWIRSGAISERPWYNERKGTRYMAAHVDRKLRLLRQNEVLVSQGGQTTLEYRYNAEGLPKPIQYVPVKIEGVMHMRPV